MIELIKDIPIKEIVLECKKSDMDKEGRIKDKYDRSELSSIADKMLKEGVVEPILVSKLEKGYRLVAGEKRLYAAHFAGFETIDAKTGYSIIPKMQSGLVVFDEYIDTEQFECIRGIYREYRNVINDFINMIDNTLYNEIQITSCSRAYVALLGDQIDKKIAMNSNCFDENSDLKQSSLKNVKTIIREILANEAYKNVDSFSCNGKTLDGFDANIEEANESIYGCSFNDVELLENLIGKQALFDGFIGRV